VRLCTEQETAARLAAVLATRAGRAVLERSHGLCLPHLQLLLTGVDAQTATALLRGQGRRLVDVAEAMRSYGLTVDTRRRDLLTPDEEGAYPQELVLLTGDKALAEVESCAQEV
jgi:hypothetical protein